MSDATIAKQRETSHEKMLGRISKLIRQAEGAPEGSPEREAFMEKAMTLSQAHSIDMVIARDHALKKEKVEEPEERKYQTGEIGHRTQSKKYAHFVDLILALGHAFDMKPLISHSNVYVWLMGYPSDHDMVEKMYGMLSVQMVAEADHDLANGANKAKRYVKKTQRVEIPDEERAWGEPVDPTAWSSYEKRYAENKDEVGQWDYYWSLDANRSIDYQLQAPPSHKVVEVLDDGGNPILEEKVISTVDGRIWRANFYQGFVNQVARRMRTARRTAMADAGIDPGDESDSRAVALVDKKEEIKDRYEREMLVRASKRGKGYGGAEVSQHSHGAQVAGAEAANKATYGDERVVD